VAIKHPSVGELVILRTKLSNKICTKNIYQLFNLTLNQWQEAALNKEQNAENVAYIP